MHSWPVETPVWLTEQAKLTVENRLEITKNEEPVAILTDIGAFSQSSCRTTVAKAVFHKCRQAPFEMDKMEGRPTGTFENLNGSPDDAEHRKSPKSITTNIISATTDTLKLHPLTQ